MVRCQIFSPAPAAESASAWEGPRCLRSSYPQLSASLQNQIKCKLFAASSFISAAQAAEPGHSGSSPPAPFRCLWWREHEHFLHALIDWSQLKNLSFVSFILICFSKPKYLQRMGKNTHTEIQLSGGSAFNSPARVCGHIWALLFLVRAVMGLRFSHPSQVVPSAAHAGPACAARGANGLRSALRLLANNFIVNFKKNFWRFWYKNNIPHPALKTMTDSLSQENL